MSEAYEGRQIVGMDLHRRRSVLVRMTEAGRAAGDGADLQRPGVPAAGDGPGRGEHRRWCWKPTYGWYWAADTLAELGAHGAPGAPAGGEGVLLPAGEERRTRRRGPGRSAADGPAARGVDRPTGHAGAARLVRHRAKLVGLRSSLKVPGPRACSPGRGAGADERSVRRRRASSCWIGDSAVGRSRGRGWTRCCGVIDRAGLRDRAVRQAGRRPAAHRPRLPRDPADPRDRAGAGRGVRRRDRRHHPLRPARAAGLLGRADPETPRVRHHRAPRPDHQAGLPAGALGRGRGRATRRRRTPASGKIRDRVAARRGRNIGVVAAARELITLVFYGLRDHHIRALHRRATRAA